MLLTGFSSHLIFGVNVVQKYYEDVSHTANV